MRRVRGGSLRFDARRRAVQQVTSYHTRRRDASVKLACFQEAEAGEVSLFQHYLSVRCQTSVQTFRQSHLLHRHDGKGP